MEIRRECLPKVLPNILLHSDASLNQIYLRIFTVMSVSMSMSMSVYSHCMFTYLHRASWPSSATLTEEFPCFFLSSKANDRLKPAKVGHGPHSSKLLCCSVYYFCVNVYCTVCFVSFCLLFVCKCVLYCLFCVVLCTVCV
jgi:hypothetical protein